MNRDYPETLVLAVHPEMTNYDVIRPVETIVIDGNEVRLIVHHDPLMVISGPQPSFNFDIMVEDGRWHIGSGQEFRFQHILPKNQHNIFRRLGKTEQAILINRAMDVKKSKFVPAELYSSANGRSGRLSDHYNAPLSKKLVVKPNDGARGIGHLVIDTEKFGYRKLNDLLHRISLGRVKTVDEIKVISGVSYHSVSENHEGEGLEALRSQGFCVTGFVDNIVAEYRIILGATGEAEYIQKRAFKNIENGYQQAIGSGYDDSVIPYTTFVGELGKGPWKDLEERIFPVIGPMSSIDLWIGKDGLWGIFEYCNQFGTVGIPMEINRKIHIDCLKHMVAKYLGIDPEGYEFNVK